MSRPNEGSRDFGSGRGCRRRGARAFPAWPTLIRTPTPTAVWHAFGGRSPDSNRPGRRSRSRERGMTQASSWPSNWPPSSACAQGQGRDRIARDSRQANSAHNRDADPKLRPPDLAERDAALAKALAAKLNIDESQAQAALDEIRSGATSERCSREPQEGDARRGGEGRGDADPGRGGCGAEGRREGSHPRRSLSGEIRSGLTLLPYRKTSANEADTLAAKQILRALPAIRRRRSAVPASSGTRRSCQAVFVGPPISDRIS